MAVFVVIAILLISLLASPALAQSRGGSPLGGGPGKANFPDDEEQKKKRRKQVPIYGPVTKTPVTRVEVVGTKTVTQQRVFSMLTTREGRTYDPDAVQHDVRTLYASGMFQQVNVFKDDLDGGKSITFKVVERAVMQYVRYIGNKKLSDKDLNKELELKSGDPLNRFAVEEARRRLQSFYLEKGFAEAHVEITEGVNKGDRGVVFEIHEGAIQRIYAVEFLGNKIASGSRLKTKIQSKPGMVSDLSVKLLWRFGGKAKMDLIDQDVDRLTAYYRSLGFFRARVGRRINYNDDRTRVTLKFVIDEGVRYRIRDIKIEGNEKFGSRGLLRVMESESGEYFNLARLQRDLSELRDHYGSKGYIFADIRGEPQFQEIPGSLDIVYKIDEGKQYRVGRILVNIDGEASHTRRTVVLNRLSLRPGDIVDIRQIRASERRLKSSQLFANNPASGIAPTIVVQPPDPDETQFAEDPSSGSSTTRGQSPRRVAYRPAHPVIDLVVRAVTKKETSPKESQP